MYMEGILRTRDGANRLRVVSVQEGLTIWQGTIEGESGKRTFLKEYWTFEEVTPPVLRPHEIVAAMKPGTVFTSSTGGKSMHIRLTDNQVWIEGNATYGVEEGVWSPNAVFTIISEPK